MTVALLIITDKDRDRSCFDRTLRSLSAAWRGPEPDSITVVDDSGNPDYGQWLCGRLQPWDATVISLSERKGFAAAIASGWAAIALNLGGGITQAPAGADWVVHVEDDFVFQSFPLPDIIRLLERRPYLAQVSLLRQPVNPDEVAAGGLVQAHPGAFTDCEDGDLRWMEQRLYWTTNPSVYPGSLVHLGWPQEPRSEGLFTHRLLDQGLGDTAGPDVRFGVWGASTDAPRVHHIGERQGTGY